MEDDDFEVTAEMLIHDDVDDESTLDEEEALLEEDEEEIANLQKESEMPLEELLAMYGYGAPPSEEEKDEDEEDEDEGEGEETTEASPETGQTSAALASQTSHARAGPSTSSSSSNVGTSSRSKRKSSSTCTTDVKPIDVDPPSPPTPNSQPLELIHEDIVNHSLMEAEVEIGEHSSSPGKSSLLGKHSRSDRLSSSYGALYRDVMLSSRTDEHLTLTSSDHAHSASVPSDHLSPHSTHPSTVSTTPSVTAHTTITASHSLPSTSSAHSQPSMSGTGPSSSSTHPERRSLRLMTAGERLAFEGYFSALFEDENSDESDDDYFPRDLHWRKEIKVGSNYQAKLPEVRKRSSRSSAAPSFPTPSSSSTSNANSSNHHDNGNSHLLGELVWNPKETTEEKVVEFLESISEEVSGMDSSGERDNEQALKVLQKCNHNVPKALEYIHKKGLSAGMKPWSEEECRNFEEGLQSLGKDFFNIQRKIPTRTVKEVVEFYYIWKKTERYDAFVQQYGKIGRKRIVYPPGYMSDFMERYLDLFATDAPELQYATTSLYAEMKKDNL